MDNSQVIKQRGALSCFKKALLNKRVTVGFLGGSITEAALESNWPEFFRGWFVTHFPDCMLTYENAAIGATGSLCALVNAKKEVIDTNCDLVFIEYAVNDMADSPSEYKRTREGLIRQLLQENRDVVLVYTFTNLMYKDMSEDRVPETIKVFEELAEHYNISSVWSGLYAYNCLKSGELSWEGWLPIAGDNLHPSYLGSSYYARKIIELFEQEVNVGNKQSILCGDLLPKAKYENNYELVTEIPLEDIEFRGAWSRMREVRNTWFRHYLYTNADGAGLTFRFEGTALMMMLNFGKRSALICYRIDGGDWIEYYGDRSWWVPNSNWCRQLMLADNLADSEHTFEMKIAHPNRAESKGMDCMIYKFVSL